VDGLVSLAIMVRTIFFYSWKCRVALDRLRVLYPRLILDDIKDFTDGEPEGSLVLFHFKGLEWIQRVDQEHLPFVG